MVTHEYIAISAIPVLIKNLITADNFGVDCSQSPPVSQSVMFQTGLVLALTLSLPSKISGGILRHM